jgi:hypothetical protein
MIITPVPQIHRRVYKCRFLVRSLLFISILLSGNIEASELPQTLVKDAIGVGQSAFIGHVVSLTETKRDHDSVIAEMSVELVQCFYGVDCSSIKNLHIRYFSKINGLTEYPVDFWISEEYLFILKHPVKGNIVDFDSDLSVGIDEAYRIDVNTAETGYEKSPYLKSKDKKVRFKSVYGARSEYIIRNDLEKWINERASQLKKIR